MNSKRKKANEHESRNAQVKKKKLLTPYDNE
jgi:hypothetical protein